MGLGNPNFSRRLAPRGRVLFAPFKRLIVEFGCGIWFVIVFLSGVLVADASQNPCWLDDRGFWKVLLVACVHFIFAGLYFRRIRHWSRWPIAVLAAVALVCFIEMSWKVWTK
jgi:hypothetical protein